MDTAATSTSEHPPRAAVGRASAGTSRLTGLLLIPVLLIATCGVTPAVAQRILRLSSGDLVVPRLPEELACGGMVDDPVLNAVRSWLDAPDRAEAVGGLRTLEPELRAEVERHPDDLVARYRLVVVLAARTELEDGDQVRLAEALYRETLRVLERDPDHPGAHHIVGRLHAAVMRLGRVERFLARTFLGGDLLDSASWALAEEHLTRAEAGDPCAPEHHYELARLHFDRGRTAEAASEVRHVLRLTRLDPGTWRKMRVKAIELMEERERE